MTTLSYDLCLLITTTQDAFGIAGMQTDDTLILGDQEFVRIEQEELAKAKISAKPIEALTLETPLIFNGCILQKETHALKLIQKKQGSKIKLIDPKSEDYKNQYREQRARGAYIAIICQPKASYNLLVAI